MSHIRHNLWTFYGKNYKIKMFEFCWVPVQSQHMKEELHNGQTYWIIFNATPSLLQR